MCKWCARQCRPVRHHSSVRAQLRPRSPHVRRQNPDPRHRNARGTCAGHVCEVASGGEGGRARGGVHMRATAPNVRVYLGVGLKGCIGPAHFLCRSRFAARPCTQGVRGRRALARLGDNQGRSYSRKGLARALRTVPSAHRRLSAVTLFVNLPMAPSSAENNSAADR